MANIDNNLATSLNSLGLGQATETRKDQSQLGQNEFMELMITQLKNQDPFKPLENGDFIAQMAQFSSVSSLSELQKSFDKLAGSLQSNQALQASSLIGRSVQVSSGIGALPVGGAMTGAVETASSSSAVSVIIQDGAGQILRRLELGPQAAGQVQFSWNGIMDNGEAAPGGSYYINAEAQADGKTIALETLVSTEVESVTLGKAGQGMALHLADGNVVDFSSVKAIQ